MLSLDDYTNGSEPASGVPAAWISGYAGTVSNQDNSLAQHAGVLGIILATDKSTSCGPDPPATATTITVIKHELDLDQQTLNL